MIRPNNASVEGDATVAAGAPVPQVDVTPQYMGVPPQPARGGPDVTSRHRGHQVHRPWPSRQAKPAPVVIHDAARCQYCGSTKPRITVNQYQGWTFGQGVALVLASFALALAMLIGTMFVVTAIGGHGPSTVPQPVAPRTATP